MCEAHLPGRYDLEVIDLYEHPELAQNEQIIAAPTLVRELPLPQRRLIGNLCDAERVLVGLNLKERPKLAPLMKLAGKPDHDHPDR